MTFGRTTSLLCRLSIVVTALSIPLACGGSSDPLTLSISSPGGIATLQVQDTPETADTLHLFAGPSESALVEIAQVPASQLEVVDTGITNELRYYRIDAFNGESLVEQSAVIDSSTLPSTSIEAVAGDIWTASNDPQLTIVGTDDGTVVGIEFRADDGDWTASADSVASLSNLLAAQYTIEVRAQDDQGNLDPTPASYTFEVAPEFAASIIIDPSAADADYTNATSPSLTLSANGAVQVQLGEAPDLAGADVIDFAAALTFAMSAGDGDKTVYARFIDDAGNQSPIVSDAIILDTVTPALAITSPTVAAQDNSLVSVAGTASDDAPLSVTINGDAVILTTGSYALDLTLVDGDHPIEVVATDAAGNASTASTNIIVDTLAPVVELLSPLPNAFTADSTILVRGTVVDTTEVEILVAGVAAGQSGEEFVRFDVPLAAGSNTLSVVVTDLLGHVTTVELTTTRDQSPPSEPTVDTITPGAGTLEVCGSAEADANVIVVVAGDQTYTATADNTGAWCTTVDGEAATAVVTAVDQAGNASPSLDASFDTVAPGIPTLSPVASPTSRRAVMLYGYAEPEARVDVAGGLAPVSTIARADTGFYLVGVELRTNRSNTLDVTASDSAGNTSALVAVEVVQSEVAPKPARLLFPTTGQSQRALVETNTNLPLEVILVDEQRLPLPGVAVEFTVVGGDGSVAGLASTQVTAGPDGLAQAALTLGSQPGPQGNLILVDVVGNEGAPVLFEASGYALNPTAATRVGGVVLDNELLPVVNATVSVAGITNLTDGEGRFSMVVGALTGPQHVAIDPTSAQGPKVYPPMTHVMEVLPGQDNDLGKPIFLPEIDLASSAAVTAASGGTVQSPDFEDLSLALGAGQATFPGGGSTGEIFVSQVPTNRVPMPLTGGLTSGLVVSVVPKDTIFDPPAPISFPNVDALPPGATVDLVSFDHDLGRYGVVGSATVSEDGSMVRSDPGSGVRRGAWHAPAPQGSPPSTGVSGSAGTSGSGTSPNGSNAPAPNQNPSTGADPINLASGELIINSTDLRWRGRGLNLAFSRSYRSRSLDTDGALGAGWYHSYQTRVVVPPPECMVFSGGGLSTTLNADGSFFIGNLPLPSTQALLQVEASCVSQGIGDQSLEIFNANGQRETFTYAGNNIWHGGAGRYATIERISDVGPTRFIMRQRGGETLNFDDFGRLYQRSDRNGNTIALWWDDQDRLRMVTDPLGRALHLSYDDDKHLTEIRDHSGRRVLYGYSGNDLITVVGPFAAGEDPGAAPTTTYSYTTPQAGRPELSHNLAQIVDAENNTILSNNYGQVPGTYSYDKVVEQVWGAGTVSLEYEALTTGGINLTTMTDRNGNRSEYVHDAAGHAIETREYSNRNVVDGDLAVRTTRREYNGSGEITRVVLPRGNEFLFSYDDANTDPRAKGNILSQGRNSGTVSGAANLIQTFTYEANYQRQATSVDAAGRTTSYGYDNRGNLLSKTEPTLTLDDGSSLAVSWSYEVNAYGQRTKSTDPEGNVTTHAYHPATDPEGDGLVMARSDLDTQTGGYLRETVIDAETSPGRNSAVPPRVRRTEFGYDVLGRIISETRPDGAVSLLEYDASNRPIRRTDAGGFVSELDYDLRGKLMEERRQLTDGNNDADFPSGFIHKRATFDEFGRQLSQAQQIAGATYATLQNEFDAKGNVLRSVTGAGRISTSEYDEGDRLAQQTTAPGSADEGVTQYRYDANSNLVERIDPMGQSLRHEYDAFDRRTRTCLPLGTCTAYEHDAMGEIVASITRDNTNAIVSQTRYDRDQGENIRIQEAWEASQDAWFATRFRRDALGRTVRTAIDDGAITTLGLDGTGAVSIRDVQGGATNSFDYDQAGRVSQRSTTETANSQTRSWSESFTYDELGRLTSLSHPNRGTRSMDYDSAGRLVASVDGRGITRQFSLDGRGLVTQAVLDAGAPSSAPLGAAGDGISTWNFSHDTDGNLIGVTTPVGSTRSFAYDSANRLQRTTYDDGSQTSYAYNARGNLIGETLPGGTSLQRVYDGEGRLIGVNAGLGTNVIGPTALSFDYDALGYIAQSQTNSHTLTTTRDSLGRRTSESLDGRSMSFGYNRSGARTTMAYTGGESLSVAVDSQGRMQSVTSDLFTGAIDREPMGRIAARLSYPGGLESTWSFDAQGRTNGIAHQNGATDLGGESYLIGDANEILGVTRTFAAQGDVFVYDGAGRLTAAHENVADVAAAVADPEAAVASNRRRFIFDDSSQLRSIDDGSGATALTLRIDGAVTDIAASTRTFDARGNLAGDGTHNYRYDAFGLLADVRDATTDDLIVGYQRDAMGRTVRRQTATEDLQLIYDGADIAEIRVIATGTALWRFVRNEGRLLAAIDSSDAAFFPMHNRGGDITGWVDLSGTVVERIRYSPFGAPSFSDAAGTSLTSMFPLPMALSGRPWDPLPGLYDMQARHYDPAIGAFLQRDPARSIITGGSPLYQYSMGDPINLTDPTGFDPETKDDFLDALIVISTPPDPRFLADLADAIIDGVIDPLTPALDAQDEIAGALARNDGDIEQAWFDLLRLGEADPHSLPLRDAEHYMAARQVPIMGVLAAGYSAAKIIAQSDVANAIIPVGSWMDGAYNLVAGGAPNQLTGGSRGSMRQVAAGIQGGFHGVMDSVLAPRPPSTRIMSESAMSLL